MPLSGRVGALRLVTVLCVLSSLDALVFEKSLKDFKVLDDVIDHNHHHEVNEIEEQHHFTYEYKTNKTKISTEGSSKEDEEEESKKHKGLLGSDDDNSLGMDALTIIWYLTTFTALFGFFIVMACTENSCQQRRIKPPDNTRTNPPTPCPSYKNFAPPSYGSVMKKLKDQKVFIVPVHEGDNNFFTNPTDIVTSPPTQANINQTNADVEKNETR